MAIVTLDKSFCKEWSSCYVPQGWITCYLVFYGEYMYISAGKEGPEIRRSWLTRQVTKEAGEFTHLNGTGVLDTKQQTSSAGRTRKESLLLIEVDCFSELGI